MNIRRKVLHYKKIPASNTVPVPCLILNSFFMPLGKDKSLFIISLRTNTENSLHVSTTETETNCLITEWIKLSTSCLCFLPPNWNIFTKGSKTFEQHLTAAKRTWTHSQTKCPWNKWKLTNNNKSSINNI